MRICYSQCICTFETFVCQRGGGKGLEPQGMGGRRTSLVGKGAGNHVFNGPSPVLIVCVCECMAFALKGPLLTLTFSSVSVCLFPMAPPDGRGRSELSPSERESIPSSHFSSIRSCLCCSFLSFVCILFANSCQHLGCSGSRLGTEEGRGELGWEPEAVMLPVHAASGLLSGCVYLAYDCCHFPSNWCLPGVGFGFIV